MYRHGPYAEQTSMEFGTRPAIGSELSSKIANRKLNWMEADVLSGVPQGTVLGPLLFLAYINDMPDSLTSPDCRLFADDSLLYCAVNKASDCKVLQQDLTALEQWEATWQMSFNPSKCTFIRVSTGRRHKYQSTYTLHW